ncbi:membrane-spanning 4-domains subfamily A member 8-like [Elgaria multicarinata webbii]|uniref:membrane-spanning 4-domains subfamily A member 8-like n=1 Tax=Elgaria multicarinata webbii TaxID=159646 RepID=UPI002FCD64F3
MQVNCSVAMNIISAIIALIGIALYISELNLVKYLSAIGVSVLLLLFSLLEFCITVSTAHFGCQVACCKREVSSFVPYGVTVASVAPPVASVSPPPPPPPAYNNVSPPPKTEAY